MFYRFYPIYNAIRGMFSNLADLDDFCVKKEIICDAEKSFMPSVSMGEDCRKLITNSSAMTTLENEWRRVDGYMANHAETVKYKFKNVLATPGGFHVMGAKYGGGREHLLGPLINNIPVLEKGFYANRFVNSTFFGHWLSDGVSTSLLKQKDESLYLWSPPSWHHAPGYLNALEIERVEAKYVFFKNMSFCIDVGMNSNRRKRIRLIKSKISSLCNASGSKRVYLSRGESGLNRKINNESALIDVLRGLNFKIVSVHDSFDEIIESCAGADIAISMEGSNFAHLMLGSCFGANHIIIVPSDQFNTVFADYLPATGDSIHNIVAVKEGDGYSVDLSRLTTIIEHIS